MKLNIKFCCISLVFIICLISCSASLLLNEGFGQTEEVRENIIMDFHNFYKTPKNYLKERDGVPFDVFWIVLLESKFDFSVYAIRPENDDYIAQDTADALGEIPRKAFPNDFIEIDGRLYLWNDGKSKLDIEVLNVLNKYNYLDSTDIKYDMGLLTDDFEDNRFFSIDDNLEAYHYYVCKKDISQFKRVKTRIAFGHYKIPKLRCAE